MKCPCFLPMTVVFKGLSFSESQFFSVGLSQSADLFVFTYISHGCLIFQWFNLCSPSTLTISLFSNLIYYPIALYKDIFMSSQCWKLSVLFTLCKLDSWANTIAWRSFQHTRVLWWGHFIIRVEVGLFLHWHYVRLRPTCCILKPPLGSFIFLFRHEEMGWASVCDRFSQCCIDSIAAWARNARQWRCFSIFHLLCTLFLAITTVQVSKQSCKLTLLSPYRRLDLYLNTGFTLEPPSHIAKVLISFALQLFVPTF